MVLTKLCQKLGIGALALVLLAACTIVPATPTVDSPPPVNQAATLDIGPTLDAIRTQAVATALAELAAQATSTPQPPAPQPTDTLAPTSTPQPVLPTATQKVVTGGTVPTKIPPSYACVTTHTSPDFGTVLSPGTDFDATWTIKNTSTQAWAQHQVDYRFLAGTKMYKYNNDYDLPQSVNVNDTLTISVDMTAPGSAGTYSTAWGIVSGTSTVLCELDITIIVK